MLHAGHKVLFGLKNLYTWMCSCMSIATYENEWNVIINRVER